MSIIVPQSLFRVSGAFRFAIHVALLAAMALLAHAAAAQQDHLREGRDYILLETPQPLVASKDKIEVIEFFNYSCPFCFRMQAPFVKWRQDSDLSDVEIIYQPVVFKSQQGRYARLHHTLEAMKLATPLRGQVFNAIHRQGNLLNSGARLGAWLEAKGHDGERAAKVYDSFTINAKIKRDERITENYGVHSTPQMAVAGKYVLSTGRSGSTEGMLRDVYTLIERERALRKKEQQ